LLARYKQPEVTTYESVALSQLVTALAR
jgi:hypothetical protein